MSAYRAAARVTLLVTLCSLALMCSSNERDFQTPERPEAGASGAPELPASAGSNGSAGSSALGGESGATPSAGGAGAGGVGAGGDTNAAGQGVEGPGGAAGQDGGGGAGGAQGQIYSCDELDDAQTQLGAAQRLVNLGYLDLVVAGATYQDALKAFQEAQGLVPDGILGPATAARLVQTNGC